jgi:hypothetical protein
LSTAATAAAAHLISQMLKKRSALAERERERERRAERERETKRERERKKGRKRDRDRDIEMDRRRKLVGCAAGAQGRISLSLSLSFKQCLIEKVTSSICRQFHMGTLPRVAVSDRFGDDLALLRRNALFVPHEQRL